MLFGRRLSGTGARPAVSKRQRVRRRWLHACVVSLLFHGLVVTLGLPRLLIASSPDIEVTYLPDLPASDDKPTDNEALADDSPKPEKKEEEPPEPDRRLAEKKPEPPKKEPKPLEVVPMPNLPMVDQDQFPDEADNDKAHFLAQKNHRAAEDVQMKERTLERPPPADSPAAPQGEPNPAPAPTAPEQRVAELLSPPQPEPQPQQRPAPSSAGASPLRLRSPSAEMSEVREAVPGGDLNPSGPGSDSPNGKERPLPISPSRLGPTDYDRLVGPALAEAERRSAALAEHGSAPGYWDHLSKKQQAIRASLENFVGRVRIGNQSELGTRKHPFAGFITAMHRQIHRFWGDGFLAEIEHKSKDIYPDSLETSIEISIAPEGTVENLVIVQHSGSLPFDTAALDAVNSAAPFPAPPDVIKSADGNVYLTWHFHRDERQCHPNYVDMHILTTPAGKSKKPPEQKGPNLASPLPGGEPRSRFLRADGSASLPNLTPASSAPTTTRPSGGSFAGSAAAASGAASAPAAPASKPTGGVPDGAREATERWLAAYQKADVRWLAGASGLPFTAGGKPIADDGAALRRFFTEMLSEGVPRRERVTYYTPSQIHHKLGRLPRGGDEDDMVFAWVDLAGEELILLLSPTDRGWSVVGLDR
jgi:TonB family protein